MLRIHVCIFEIFKADKLTSPVSFPGAIFALPCLSLDVLEGQSAVLRCAFGNPRLARDGVLYWLRERPGERPDNVAFGGKALGAEYR